MEGETIKAEFFVSDPTPAATRHRSERGARSEAPTARLAGVMTLHHITDLLASEREREQFLSIVSHELRTPLTPL